MGRRGVTTQARLRKHCQIQPVERRRQRQASMYTRKIQSVHTNTNLVKLSLAEDWGVDEDGYDLSWPTEHSKFEIPTDLQLTMVALLLDEDHYEEEKAAKNRPRSTGLISRPMYLYLAFRDAIAQRLTMYATTIAQDTEMLQDRRLKRRQRMAVEVRLGEKEILATTLDATTKQIEEIEGEFKEECEDMEAMQSAKKRKT